MRSRPELTITAIIILLIALAGPAAAADPDITYSFDFDAAENIIDQNGQPLLIKNTVVTIPVNIRIQGGTLYSYAVDASLSGGGADLTLEDCVSWTPAVNGHKLASTVSVGGGIKDTSKTLFIVKIKDTGNLPAGEYTLTIKVSAAASPDELTAPYLIEQTKTLTFKTARTVTAEVNDITRGTITATVCGGLCQDLTANTHKIIAPEGEDLTLKISPVQGFITKSLKVDDTTTAGGSGNTYVIKGVDKDHTISAVFDPEIPEKKEPVNPTELEVIVTDEGKEEGISDANVHFDASETLTNEAKIEISATLTEPPQEEYAAVNKENTATVLIVEIISNVQPQKAGARVTLKLDKSIVKYPETVEIYHNVQTSPGQWEQHRVSDQRREADESENYVYSFLATSFSYFTFVEWDPPAPSPSPVPSPAPAPIKPSGGGSVDTGSGHYTEYPRTVTDGGFVSFGTSPVITGVDLPKGTSGQITLYTGIPDTVDEGIYSAAEIRGPEITEHAVVYFTVNTYKMETAGYTTSDIILCLKQNDKWVPLKTYFIKTDGSDAKYYAETDTLGIVAVVYHKNGTIMPSFIVFDDKTPVPDVTPSTSENLPAAEAVPAETPAPTAGLIAGLMAAWILRRRIQK